MRVAAEVDMRAGELCIRSVVTAFANETAVDAARRMVEHQVGDVIIVDEAGDGGAHPIGIVTDRDLVTRVLTRTDHAPSEIPLSAVMEEALVTAFEDDDIESVLAKMRAHAIRRIPIVNAVNVLQGILSLDDVVAWMAEQLDVAVGLLERQSERPS